MHKKVKKRSLQKRPLCAIMVVTSNADGGFGGVIMIQVTQKGKNMLERMSLMQKYTGCAREAVAFLEKEQLLDERLWKICVEQYRATLDGTNKGWRGEYWGKMMRGAVTVYQ